MEHVRSIFGIGFLSSSHKMLYRRIGKEYGISARMVYRLAHGMRPHTHKEMAVVFELLGSGIIVCE